MSDITVTVDETTLDITVAVPGPQGPAGTGGGGGGATALVDLTDVTGTPGTGKAPVSDGAGHFPLTDVATQTELNAEASARASADTAAIASSEGYADAAIAGLSAVYQPLDSDLTAIAALATTSFGRSLLALADASALRTAAALGTAATANTGDFDTAGAAAAAQAASQPLDSDLTAIAALTTTTFGRALLALADAAALRTTAGLVIGTDVEAHDSDLTTIAGLTATNDDVLQRKAGSWANRTIVQLLADLAAAGTTFQPLDSDLTAIAALTTTSFGRSLLALADAAALRTAAGLVIGTDVQAFDAELAAIAGLVSAANKLPYFTASGTASLADLTAAGRAIIDDADAAAQRTTLGLVIGTDVEAHDSDLTAIAALAPTNDDIVQRKAGAWTNRTMAQLISDLAALGTTFQPLDSDLTSIAALSTTSYGRALLTLANAAAADWITKALVTTKGDIIAASAASTPARVAVGSDGQVLTADAASTAGVKWAAAGGGSADKLGLTPTAVKTSGYTAAVGDFVPVDTSGGAVTITLPTAPADGSVIEIKLIKQASGNAVTINCGGSDVFNVASGLTVGTLTLLNQGVLLLYKSSSAIWYAVADALSLSQMDARGYGDEPRIASGRYTALRNASATQADSPGQNIPKAVPFGISQKTTLTLIGLEVTTAVALAVFRLGIFKDVGGIPVDLVADYGTIDASSTGFKSISISQVLLPGLYWYAATMQGATGAAWRAFKNSDGANDPRTSGLATSGFQNDCVLGPTTSGAYGSTFGTLGNGNQVAPRVVVSG